MYQTHISRISLCYHRAVTDGVTNKMTRVTASFFFPLFSASKRDLIGITRQLSVSTLTMGHKYKYRIDSDI